MEGLDLLFMSHKRTSLSAVSPGAGFPRVPAPAARVPALLPTPGHAPLGDAARKPAPSAKEAVAMDRVVVLSRKAVLSVDADHSA